VEYVDNPVKKEHWPYLRSVISGLDKRAE